MHTELKSDLMPVPDFASAPVDDITGCAWWRKISVGLHHEADDKSLEAFLHNLMAAFEDQGHDVGATQPEVLFAPTAVPDGNGHLRERVAEAERPVVLDLQRYGNRPPAHVVGVVRVTERMSEMDHAEVVDISRHVMARLGTPKVIFVSGQPNGEVEETTFTTLEGGHPSDPGDSITRLRDRLVAAACTREVGKGFDFIEGQMPEDVWTATDTPEALIEAGHRMDKLGLLPSPRLISEYVSPRLAALYSRYLGLKGFSEGMLFAYDPPTETLMLTASGSWDVDKRALRREEVVPVRKLGADGRLEVLVPAGVTPKGPSVESLEVKVLLDSVATVGLGLEEGRWRITDTGAPAPLVRAGIHTHVGVVAVDPDLIESLPANREQFPYGFGCGTDLMCQVVQDVAKRSSAMNDPDDRRRFVRWPMLYHGDMMVELWKPEAPPTPLSSLLDLYEDGSIDYTPHHLTQPVP